MKRFLTVTLVLMSLVLAAVPACAAGRFSDVPANSYYAEAVDWAVNHDPVITRGTSSTKFSPNKYCTRAEAVTFLWRAMGCPDAVMQYCPFTDVNSGSYYYKAVMWANEKGITTGTSDTTFSPDAVCTRGQIVTFLWRAMGRYAASSNKNPFTDVKKDSYYEYAVLWAYNHNPVITKGTSSTKFSPNKYCTRAEIVTFLYRLNPAPRPDMAPYLIATYANPPEGTTYDVLCIDWKCDIDARDTYWCTMNWYNASSGNFTGIVDGSGYAGFQNVGGTHKVIMSIWDTSRGKPTIEYSKTGSTAGRFGGEGTGVQVLTDYPWKAGVWYTMWIQARTENGKTFYDQFVKPEGGSFECIASISVPIPDLGFTWACAFQEDWLYNNYYRSCYLRNAKTGEIQEKTGKVSLTDQNTYEVRNTAGKAEGESNVRYNCDFAAAEGGLWMQSGGSDYTEKCRVKLPATINVA